MKNWRTDQKIAMTMFVTVVAIILAFAAYGYLSGAWERVSV